MKNKKRRERPQENDSNDPLRTWSGGPVPEENGRGRHALLAVLAGAVVLGVFFFLTRE